MDFAKDFHAFLQDLTQHVKKQDARFLIVLLFGGKTPVYRRMMLMQKTKKAIG